MSLRASSHDWLSWSNVKLFTRSMMAARRATAVPGYAIVSTAVFSEQTRAAPHLDGQQICQRAKGKAVGATTSAPAPFMHEHSPQGTSPVVCRQMRQNQGPPPHIFVHPGCVLSAPGSGEWCAWVRGLTRGSDGQSQHQQHTGRVLGSQEPTLSGTQDAVAGTMTAAGYARCEIHTARNAEGRSHSCSDFAEIFGYGGTGSEAIMHLNRSEQRSQKQAQRCAARGELP